MKPLESVSNVSFEYDVDIKERKGHQPDAHTTYDACKWQVKTKNLNEMQSSKWFSNIFFIKP